MESIKRVFKVGPGPSSSHTIGPFNAAKDFLNQVADFDEVEINLYGSLALTGKGHGTDKILKTALKDYACEINFNYTFTKIEHPNTIDISAFKNGKLIDKVRYFSIGGGDILKKGDVQKKKEDIYPFNTFNGLKNYLKKEKIQDIALVIDKFENNDINKFLENVLNVMFLEVEKGLQKEGLLPGNLGVKRVAKKIFEKANESKDDAEKRILYLTSFAYAASEENAAGEIVVTAPTCGSCGILPSILYYAYKYQGIKKEKLIDALKVAGLMTNFIIKNASISGASLGCQAEIGSASSITNMI